MDTTACLLMCCVFALTIIKSASLNNGLARTPPMGWLDWERFRCNIDCKHDPENCISEKLFMKMADVMSTEGYADVGYEYIIMDDCWAAKKRDKNERIQPDPDRFPNGIKALADYVHSKGLKFGLYASYGAHTCAGYPSIRYHLQMDAQTYADWGVDYLKLDNCASDPHQFVEEYPPIAFWLNKTGRPILLGCEYARDQIQGHLKPNYHKLAAECNLCRNSLDMQDSWSCVSDVIDYYGDDTGNFSEVAGPGYFNDPDVLVIGNFGLSHEQEKAQMAMWAILAAPLVMSNDLRAISPQAKAILQHRGAIAVNQDKLGVQGKRIYVYKEKRWAITVWTKRILPHGSMAFVFLNSGDWGAPIEFSIPLKKMNLHNPQGYNITEIFTGKSIGLRRPTDNISVYVNPSGVFFGKAVPQV